MNTAVDNNASLDKILGSTPSGSQSMSSALGSWDTLTQFLQSNQMLLTMILVLGCAAAIVALILHRRAAKRPTDPLQAFGVSTPFKLLAALLIVALTAADLFATSNMFSGFNLKIEETRMFSFAFALFLEGFPFALGLIDPLKKDPGQFVMQRGRYYRMLSRLCWCFLVLSWCLAILIRILYTEQTRYGGFEAFLDGTYTTTPDRIGRNDNNTYLAQVFLFASPIITSVLAYVLSWLAFSSTCLHNAAKLVRSSHKLYMQRLDAYERINHRRQDATSALWASVTGDVNAVPPREFEDFRNQSMAYMLDMMIAGCLDAYPAMLKRYNHEVEAAMTRYIAELSRMSTVPQRINQITVGQIINEYDQAVSRDVDKWDYELCEPAMCGDLEELLNDAVIGSQFNATSK